MKYKVTLLSYLLVGMGIFGTSCKKELEDKFQKPNALTDASIETLFTGTLQTWGLYQPVYGDEYHNLRNMNRLLGLGYYNGETDGKNTAPDGSITMYNDWSGGTLRNTLYNRVYVDSYKNIPVINLKLGNLSGEERDNYSVYVNCINITRAFMFQRVTDVYNSIPYTEAGGAYDGKFWPKYDTQKEIYYDMLAQLKTIAGKLHGYTLNQSQAHKNFPVYDILNDGSVAKWEKFCNSLRLRMAMRLSVVDPAKAQEVIGELLSTNAPMVTDAADLVGMATKEKSRIFEVYWYRSFNERVIDQVAPYFLVNDVFGYTNGPSTPANQVDPRLYVLFQPNKDGKYIGEKPWGPEQTAHIDALWPVGNPDRQKAKTWDYDDNTNPFFSMYNKMTFYNFDRKFPVFTPSETHLLLAEAALRFPGVAGGINPVQEYKTAIAQSIDWMYSVNNSNQYSVSSTPSIPLNVVPGSQYPKPAQAVIDAFLTTKSAYFTGLTKDGKIKEIFYQKFAHLNILGQYEIWAEARRLRKEYGNLLPNSTKMKWIERFMYPENEPSVNPEKFDAVKAQNDYFTPVWWTGR
ncbi:SusD/RagB family nutrient-binding outer membrane lipoprotein [Chitinophagaceae bacterium LB-8]|uniref:SusD/RagB family nutrient-binding outer membrane lipoprotein n=1 Tax=Paraflavisolibacter caeni TaxID=2982496 RepID=A0A9X2XPJ9_9BACT|nr:SusD/RagB family nutrient-binding outer membrane lipoprotein [Paraflavisolibacter caeni]MCU7551084.1 SusD/RagB family nutrient-binding outer membrane lipoprotein [Paraflavisolibacter caeni]